VKRPWQKREDIVHRSYIHCAGARSHAPLAARIPPVRQPPTIGFHRSCLPRVFSTKHSVQEKMPPITSKFLPHDLLCAAISFPPLRNCSRIGKFEFSRLVTDELKGASTAPSTMPAPPPTTPAIIACIVHDSFAAWPGSTGGCHTEKTSPEMGISVHVSKASDLLAPSVHTW
jgi:hypothetical protein